MKKTIVATICLSILIFSGISAQINGYWNKSNGPDGMAFPNGETSIFSFTQVTAGGKIYVNNYLGDYYRSVDNGLNWAKFDNPVIDSLANPVSRLIVGRSGRFYKVIQPYGSDSLRLYESDDEGLTWVLKNKKVIVTNIFECADGALLGSTTSEIYKSTDGGATWLPVYYFGGIKQYDYFIQYENGTIQLFSTKLYSFDGGSTWKSILYSYDDFSFQASSGTVFDAYGIGELERTTNQGNTWTSIHLPVQSEFAYSIVEINGHLLLTTDQHVYTSSDDGLTWQNLNVTGLKPVFLCTITPLPNGDLLGASGPALIRSSDGGAHWSFSSYNMHHPQINQIETINDTIQYAVSSIGLWKTTNSGTDWTLLLVDTAGYNYPKTFNYAYFTYSPLALLSQDSLLFIAEGGKHLWRSFDGGATFQDKSPGSTIISSNLFRGKQSNRIFCTTQQGLYYSDNFGDTWTLTSSKLTLESTVRLSATKLYAIAFNSLTYDQNLWLSTDNGQSWQAATIPQVNKSEIRALARSAQGTLYVFYLKNNRLQLAVSNDEGQSWITHKVATATGLSGDLTIRVNASGHIFIITDFNQILSSTDQGQSWFAITGLNYNLNPIENLNISPAGYLYCSVKYGGLYRSAKSSLDYAFITGNVRRDADGDCSTPDAQDGLPEWIITVGGLYNGYVSTDENGHYQVAVDPGQYTMHLSVPQALWWTACDTVQTITLTTPGETQTVNFTAIAAAECPLMSVDVSITHLRRCFNNPVYLQYCNQGTQTADSAFVDIKLDPYLTLVQCALPHVALTTDSFRVFLGTVPSGNCEQFFIQVYLNCDSTVLGQTHCVTAHAYPDTLCKPVDTWSGASIQAKVTCQDSVVRIRLKNTGPAMSQVLGYIIIEDDVVLLEGQRSYGPGDEMVINEPANGHTWRVESMQEPGHPFSNRAVGFEEGCGGFVTLGYINHFPVNGLRPSWETECRQNTNSYDPNDKQGFPLGSGPEHIIHSGQELEYMIRFQNTGTDTAFTVVIRDTLSDLLDPATIQPGASSHPYKWELRGAGILSFTFNNILLPDSTTNLAKSQGFINFRVKQKPGLHDGQTIFNTAGIYFDFNDPVMTNQTWHTIGSQTVDVKTPNHPAYGADIQLSPNPMDEYTVFSRTDHTDFKHCRMILTDVLGHTVRESAIEGAKFQLQRQGLPAGVYYYRVENADNTLFGAGKLIMH